MKGINLTIYECKEEVVGVLNKYPLPAAVKQLLLSDIIHAYDDAVRMQINKEREELTKEENKVK